jgi:hypothetical protein
VFQCCGHKKCPRGRMISLEQLRLLESARAAHLTQGDCFIFSLRRFGSKARHDLSAFQLEKLPMRLRQRSKFDRDPSRVASSCSAAFTARMTA